MMQLPGKEFSAREESIAAAAYMLGLARGVAVDRSQAWARKVRRSALGTTKAFGTAVEILRDGCTSNPLLIYELQELAKACGLHEHNRDCQPLIAAHLKPLREVPA
jgi:hypothetical protein